MAALEPNRENLLRVATGMASGFGADMLSLSFDSYVARSLPYRRRRVYLLRSRASTRADLRRCVSRSAQAACQRRAELRRRST